MSSTNAQSAARRHVKELDDEDFAELMIEEVKRRIDPPVLSTTRIANMQHNFNTLRRKLLSLLEIQSDD